MLLLGLPQEVAKKGTKGPNALSIPATQKVVSLSLHSFFAKVSSFRFCVGVFNKNADTRVARTPLLQAAIASASFLVTGEMSNRNGKAKALALSNVILWSERGRGP